MELFDPSLSPIVGSTGDLGFGDYQSTTLTPGFQRLSTTTTNAGGGMGPLDLGGNTVPELCITLRRLARDALEKRIHESSCYFAGKLVTLSQGRPEDVLLLAQGYFQGKDYRRAVHILERHGLLAVTESPEPLGILQLTPTRLDAYFLAAQCLAIDKPEECLQLLEQVMPWEDDEDPLGGIEHLLVEEENQSGGMESFPMGGASQGMLLTTPEGNNSSLEGRPRRDLLRILGAMCCLRGRVYESQDNRARAVTWLKTALRVDIYCAEALEFLVDRKLLSKNEEKRLLEQELVFGTKEAWLRALYSSRLCLQDPEQVLKERFRALDEVYGLGENPSVLTAKAEVAYYQQDSQTAYQLAKKVYECDPYNYSCLPIYLCAMSDLALKSELYYVAHQLVEAHSKNVVSWFAVGCYYSTVKKHDAAQRYFHKATKIDPRFAPAWIGFGNAFAAQDESDQAMAAYRTASRLTSSHLPNLYMGMEYVRTNNTALAHHFLRAAQELCNNDPLLYNELGVVLFRMERYDEAAAACQRALDLCKAYNGHLTEKWDTTLVNLGHCYRKRQEYGEAIKSYEMAIGLCPRRASSFAALALTHHLRGSLDVAIEYYHRALGLKPDDTFSSEMLSRALQDVLLVGESSIMKVAASSQPQHNGKGRQSMQHEESEDMMEEWEGDGDEYVTGQTW